ncbi:hypothetical protein HYV21_02690 [Candidatus Microgenomates bacterium]|nr:hypothetical protein [Candidatus Microgenomates bacterium]
MSEPAQPENPMSNPERPLEGVTPHEQAVVKRAEEEARSSSVEAVRQAGYVAPQVSSQEQTVSTLTGQIPETAKVIKEVKAQLVGDLLDREPIGVYQELGIRTEGAAIQEMVPPQERLRMERERQVKYTEGSWIAEMVRTSEDPDTIRAFTRKFMAEVEQSLTTSNPGIHRLEQVRNYLIDRADMFRAALNPQESWAKDINRVTGLLEKMVERRVTVTKAQEVAGGLVEVELNEEERDRLELIVQKLLGMRKLGIVPPKREGKTKYIAVLDQQAVLKLRRDDEGRGLLVREEVIPATLTRGKLERLVMVFEEMRTELLTRERIFVARYLRRVREGLLDQLTKLFERPEYAWLKTEDFRAIFEAGPLKEGERPFGEKIDMAMRLYTLIGIGGGPERDEAQRKTAAEQRIQIEATKPWLRKWLEQNIGDTQKQAQFLGKLAEYAARNIFCDSPPYEEDTGREEWIKEVREWVVSVINGDKGDREDTKAAEDLGWGIFYMFGFASYFDNRREGETPNGWPSSDDTMKLMHPEAYREREKGEGQSHNYGPHATFGKYDEMAREHGALNGKFMIMVPFLHWALPTRDTRLVSPDNPKGDIKVKDMKTFWERWWNDGTEMKDLPWRTIREYSWFYYNLALYFAGGYGREEEDRSLWGLINRDFWERSKLINIHTLQDINRTVEYAVGGWSLHQGEIQKWLQSLPGNKRRGVENLSARQFTEQFVEPVRKRIRELILVGALTSAYHGGGRWAWTEWGEWPMGGASLEAGVKASDVRKEIRRILEEAGFSKEWDTVKKETEAFLKSRRVL